MGTWQLGIDFGTSYTVAAVLEDNQVRVMDIESNGQARIPSVVFQTTDGDLLVGTAAQHQAVFAPERFEPSPKRCIADGDVFLGDGFVPVADLVSAVLKKVYSEACRQHGEELPTAVRVTHPAEWADARLNVLRGAIAGAGLPNAALVAEPVAAAAWIAMAKTAPGGHIAVYDFGGGTFDAAVLRRTDEGFEVAGPPSGRDPLGGEDLDRLIIGHLGSLLSEDFPDEWRSLMNPPDAAWRRSVTALKGEVQRAKEILSDVLVCQLWVPGIEKEIQLTRRELEDLIGADVSETVTSLVEAIEAASLKPKDLDGIYLVGGSSRIPLVADTIWRALGVQPTVQDNPKSVVAMGAAAWGSTLHRAALAAAEPEAKDPAKPSAAPKPALDQNRYRSHIVMVKGAGAEQRGSTFSSMLLIEQPGAPTVRLREEPAGPRDVFTISQENLQSRSSRMVGFVELSIVPSEVLGVPGGLERRFTASSPTGTVQMFERYLATEGRVFVLAAPEQARAVADTVKLAPAGLPAARYFESRFTLQVPIGSTVSERATLVQGGTGYQIIADQVQVPARLSLPEWRDRQLGALLASVPGATVTEDGPSRVLGRIDGEAITIKSGPRHSALLTKLWLAVLEDRYAYEVTITLREKQKALFATLAAIAMLNPTVVPQRLDTPTSAPT